MRRYHTYPPHTIHVRDVCVGSCMRIYRLRIELRSELYAHGAECVPTPRVQWLNKNTRAFSK